MKLQPLQSVPRYLNMQKSASQNMQWNKLAFTGRTFSRQQCWSSQARAPGLWWDSHLTHCTAGGTQFELLKGRSSKMESEQESCAWSTGRLVADWAEESENLREEMAWRHSGGTDGVRECVGWGQMWWRRQRREEAGRKRGGRCNCNLACGFFKAAEQK